MTYLPLPQKIWISHYFLCFVSAATSRDAVDLGYRTVVIDDACRGVTEEAITKAKSQLQQSGALILQSNDVSSSARNVN